MTLHDTAPVAEGESSPHPTTEVGDPRPSDQPVLTTGSGMTIPRLGFGTWQLEGSQCQEMVEHALQIGVRHLDTAQMYGNEDAVGAAIAASGISHDDVFVTTKIDNESHEPDTLRRSLDESLDRLGLDRVDLTLIHWPVEWDRMGATLQTLANVHAAGATRHIGVSNFTVAQLDEVHDAAPLECLQVECHPYLPQNELRQWCADHGWAFTAYSPIAQGQVFDDDELTELAARHDIDAAQLALAWLLSLDGVVAIPRTSDPDHLEVNWAAKDVELDADTIEAIGAIERRARIVEPDFAPW